jgi:hypothetical protein
MRIYLAARYARIDEMRCVATTLTILGHQITSRWILGADDLTDEPIDEQEEKAIRAAYAYRDREDLEQAQCCISFTESPSPTMGRGGRHAEFGIALERHLKLIVVGPRENLFHFLPEVSVYPNRVAMLKGLGATDDQAEGVIR